MSDNEKLAFECAVLIDSIDTPSMPEEIISFLLKTISFDSSLIMFYYQNRSPLVLYNAFEHTWRKNTINNYLKGAYLLDPFYLLLETKNYEGLHRLLDIAPDGFTDSKYFNDYYLHSNIKDELCFLIPIDDVTTLCICLERSNQNHSFSIEEQAKLSTLFPLLKSVVKKHYELNLDTTSNEPDLGEALTRAFNSFASSVLTNRECEVVKLLLKGHSIRSSAEKLNISPGTVKVHRENIYYKLGISSQAELFHLFIDSVSTLQLDFVGDPLENYIN